MNEETKDTRMLPVQCNCAWNPDRHADSCPVNLRDRLADAQARLAEKDARIAQLAAHARGKNKALANALKEIERLNGLLGSQRLIIAMLGTCGMNIGNEREQLRAQLAQIQAAPAERGVVVLPDGFRVMWPTSVVLHDGDRWEIYAPCGSGGAVNTADVKDWVVRELLDALARLNPAPATADSDAREVSE